MSHSIDSSADRLTNATFCVDSLSLGGEFAHKPTHGSSFTSSEAQKSQTNKDVSTVHTNSIAQDLSALVELTSRVSVCEDITSAGAQVTSDLAECIEQRCEEPSLKSLCLYHIGLASPDSTNAIGEPHLLAQSHSFSSNKTETQALALAAVRECVARGQNASWVHERADRAFSRGRHALLCHQQLAKHTSAAEVTSIRLVDIQGTLCGVLLLIASTPLPEQAKRFAVSAASPLASHLTRLNRVRRRSWSEHLSSWWGLLRSRKLTLGLVLFLCAVGIGSLPLPYRVETSCEVHPTHRHFVTAPFDGILQRCELEPGDSVSHGETLALMDGRDLELELSQIEADLHRAKKVLDGHLVLHESGDARIAQLELDRLSARRELLLLRQQRLAIQAPASGVLLNSEISESDGAPLEQGEILFEIGPVHDLKFELGIPDEDVRHVQLGQRVTIRLDAFPFETWQGTVDRISPASEIVDDANVFVASVTISTRPNASQLENTASNQGADTLRSGMLRPGMQGTAQIECDTHPLAWNLFQKPVSRCIGWFRW